MANFFPPASNLQRTNQPKASPSLGASQFQGKQSIPVTIWIPCLSLRSLTVRKLGDTAQNGGQVGLRESG